VSNSCSALPSGQAAFDLVAGDPAALPRVLGFTAARAGLIALGLLAFGEKDSREHLIRHSIGGACGIEVFVLAWALWKKRETS
jgi:hypothetical protein